MVGSDANASENDTFTRDPSGRAASRSKCKLSHGGRPRAMNSARSASASRLSNTSIDMPSRRVRNAWLCAPKLNSVPEAADGAMRCGRATVRSSRKFPPSCTRQLSVPQSVLRARRGGEPEPAIEPRGGLQVRDREDEVVDSTVHTVPLSNSAGSGSAKSFAMQARARDLQVTSRLRRNSQGRANSAAAVAPENRARRNPWIMRRAQRDTTSLPAAASRSAYRTASVGEGVDLGVVDVGGREAGEVLGLQRRRKGIVRRPPIPEVMAPANVHVGGAKSG